MRHPRLSLVLPFLLAACDPTKDTGHSTDLPDTSDSSVDSADTQDSEDSEDSEDSADSEDTEDSGYEITIPHEEGCDDLNPLYCPYPYPSDVLLEEDASTATGYRLAFTPQMLPGETGKYFDFASYERLDGVSPSTQILTVFDVEVDLEGAASWADIGRSLEEDSPTVILDLETGERVAHWAELDARTDVSTQRSLYLRLAGRLQENHRYAVAIRGLSDTSGVPVEPFDAFRALRDDLRSDSEALEARRPSYESMFETLQSSGIERSELQSAWWFHTASGQSLRGDMLHIREDALMRLGEEGIGCTVTSVQESYGDDGLTFRRLRGTFTVPSYMDSASPPARFVRGEDDLPVFVENVEVPFTLLVPQSLIDGGARPGPLVTFGHGLLGNSEDYLAWSDIRRMAWAAEAVMVATDWDGMSWEDLTVIASALSDPSFFTEMAERSQQGMINQIALTRTFSGVCRNIPELVTEDVELVDPDRRYFVGVSQGGILGGTLLSLSPDIERAILLVGGAIFPFMIERSIDFAPYFPLFESAWPERLDQAFILALSEHLWDHSESAGYVWSFEEGLEDIGPKTALYIAAENDAQVPNLSTDVAVRMAGAPVIRGSVREPWGIDVVDAPVEGSAYITIDMGDPPVPDGNLAPESDAGGHQGVCLSDTALAIMRSFIDDERVIMPCEGECDPD